MAFPLVGCFRIAPTLGLVSALACRSSLPDYAAPKGEMVHRSEIDSKDLIPYRTLTRDDFKATEPPPHARPYADKMGAATCVHALGAPDNHVTTIETPSATGESTFEARIEQARFDALMDRTCSWWNPKFTAAAASYVLEHEQIHFALTEVETRRLNRSLLAVRGERFTGSSAAEVQRLANEKIQETLKETLDTILDRNRRFDEETSFGFKPERQKQWLARVTSELKETAEN
jgi:hypothetical protein